MPASPWWCPGAQHRPGVVVGVQGPGTRRLEWPGEGARAVGLAPGTHGWLAHDTHSTRTLDGEQQSRSGRRISTT
jgi:hypothetical protein